MTDTTAHQTAAHQTSDLPSYDTAFAALSADLAGTVAPVAPVAPAAPVAPVAPVAPATVFAPTTLPAGAPTTEGMTITGLGFAPIEFGLVAFDLYKDIHKGIRCELFGATIEAGRLDPADRDGRAALSQQVHGLVDLLVAHAEHEDGAIQPVLESQLPVLAEKIEADHIHLEERMDVLIEMADGALHAPHTELRPRVHHLYLELASFTSAYLAHQDIEERVVMPSLETAIGVPEVISIHEAIIGSIPPAEMAQSLALMLPAMNVDDRADMLGGMQAGAPPEVFAGVWSLVGSVLAPADHAALARRLDLY